MRSAVTAKRFVNRCDHDDELLTAGESRRPEQVQFSVKFF